MKVYTKKGDKGTTGLIGGTRLPKHHIRIESYGTVDELNSYIGLLRDLISEESKSAVLIEIQDRLFTIGSHLAADPVKSKMTLPELFESQPEREHPAGAARPQGQAGPAHAGGSHRNNRPIGLYQSFKGLSFHHDVFPVHGMLLHIFF